MSTPTDTARFLFVWNGARGAFVALWLRVSTLNCAGRAVLTIRMTQHLVQFLSHRVLARPTGHCATKYGRNTASTLLTHVTPI